MGRARKQSTFHLYVPKLPICWRNGFDENDIFASLSVRNLVHQVVPSAAFICRVGIVLDMRNTVDSGVHVQALEVL